jgi:hypothetical protein
MIWPLKLICVEGLAPQMIKTYNDISFVTEMTQQLPKSQYIQ